MKAYIKAISYYLPVKVVTNEELVSEFPEWSIDKVAAKVGVNSRHLAAEDETAGDMAEKAAYQLFSEHHIDPQNIVFFVTLYPKSGLLPAHRRLVSCNTN